MAESQTTEGDRWRAKYYDQLEQLERKEREWQQIEEMLRQGLLRLSLAAEHGDTELDRALDELRSALRRGTESAALGRWLERIPDAVTRLERARRERDATQGNDDAAVGRQLLIQLTQRIIKPRAEQESKLLLGRLQGADGAELSRITEELSATLNEMLTRGDDLPLHLALLQLVEYLTVPAELEREAEAVKALLANPLDPGQADVALRRIAGLVAEMRRKVVQEKRELEGFLRQLTENLQELDQNLNAAAAERRESFSEGRKLGQTMNAHMEDLEASVNSASELDTLKSAIQQRVTTIRSHMALFREAEERRSARAEQSVAALTARLHEVETEAATLRTRIQRERNQAMSDPLTGIQNRLAYDERLEQEFQRWKRYRSPLVLSVWDVDRFKRINDGFGHQAGDKVLKVVAKLLAAQVRATDFVCRYGGEEFVMLLPETTLQSALAVSEKLRLSVETADFHYRGEKVKITVSCGLAEFREGDTPDEVFARADKALYMAKEQGRNCCRSE